jgi:ribosomal protein L11 methyltransferase
MYRGHDVILAGGGWKIQVIVPPEAVDCFVQALDPLCAAVVSFEVEGHGAWRVAGYTSAAPAPEAVAAAIAIAALRAQIAEPAVARAPVPATDWVAESQRGFQPLRAGRYFIRPSHFRGRAPGGAISITLDAGAAFGTGEHATTRGCLLALDWLARARRFTRPLDLGCGSGILALAIAATWRRPVTAVDIDPVAVAVARANARGNRLAPLVRVLRGDGLSARGLRQRHDLITANILARPLVDLSGAIRRRLEPGGVAVLSGLLANQENMVRAAYRRHGLRLVRRIAIDGWNTLVVAR